jgi:NADPH:quinone reductase-like Zn-dependent oxidoreductase
MKAATYHRYGTPDVIEVRDVAAPTAGPGELLVRVAAAGVDPGVWFFLTGRPYLVRTAAGFRGPRRQLLGRALAGTVEAVGEGVTAFAPGDEVYGEIPAGAYAEYAVGATKLFARKPARLSWAEAAAVPLSGTTALQGLRDTGRLRPGQRVLVVGAAGSVGTFAVQLAKAMGAHVTGVCGTTGVPLVESLGADRVLDRTREDFLDEPRFDVVLDLPGIRPLADYRRALAPRGTLVMSAGPPAHTMRRNLTALALAPVTRQRLRPLLARPRGADLEELGELLEAGTVRPVVDRTYPLADVADALRHWGAGHARGKTVVTIPA